MKKKVCIVASSLTHGGAEKAAANQSFVFSDLGFEVHIVTVSSGVSYAYKGKIYDLGQFKPKNDKPWLRVSRLLKFRSYLKDHNFDLIIDNRPRNQAYREFLITKYIYRNPVIYVIHSYEASLAFTRFKWLNILLYRNKMLVAVSKSGAKKFKGLLGLKKLKTIYNSIDFEFIKRAAEMEVSDPLDSPYIMYYGRLHNASKNLKLLLESYERSELKQHGVKLILVGNGEDLDALKAYSRDLGISSSVMFTGFKTNPFPYLKKALFSVLTSRSEGFGLVIPESFCLGVPVVSVACEAGPKELITNNRNGILVENYNVNALAEAMNKMALNEAFRASCSEEAKRSVEPFSLEVITNDWKHYLHDHNLL